MTGKGEQMGGKGESRRGGGGKKSKNTPPLRQFLPTPLVVWLLLVVYTL